MIGRRLPDVNMRERAGWPAWEDRQPGDYMRVTCGERVTWYICDPLGRTGQIGGRRINGEMVADLLIPVVQPPVVAPWEIVEHEDGTITVSPSIMDPEPGGWHGYLRRGVWEDAS